MPTGGIAAAIGDHDFQTHWGGTLGSAGLRRGKSAAPLGSAEFPLVSAALPLGRSNAPLVSAEAPLVSAEAPHVSGAAPPVSGASALTRNSLLQVDYAVAIRFLATCPGFLSEMRAASEKHVPRFGNPNGIQSLSPGLVAQRPTLGSRPTKRFNPEGVESNSRASRQRPDTTLSGLNLLAGPEPRVGRCATNPGLID